MIIEWQSAKYLQPNTYIDGGHGYVMGVSYTLPVIVLTDWVDLPTVANTWVDLEPSTKTWKTL